MLYVRFPLSLRNVEDLLHERVYVRHEAVQFWRHRFGPMFASNIRKCQVEGMKFTLARAKFTMPEAVCEGEGG